MLSSDQDKITLKPATRLNGVVSVPGDKSISHRALLFGALAEGETQIRGILKSEDVLSTAQCLRALGADIRFEEKRTTVKGPAKFGSPGQPLDCGNSGTTLRLLMGALAPHDLEVEFVGDASLSRRPMSRVADPLREMGARVTMTHENYLPLRLKGGALRPIEYDLPVASAQVKSAILLAGLQSEGTTILRGKIESRDHTERLLPTFGAEINVTEHEVSVIGRQRLRPAEVSVPGDPSSAAFFLAAGAVVPDSKIFLTGVGLNPTRTGFIQVLRRMGAEVKESLRSEDGEPWGDLEISSTSLRGTRIDSSEVPSLIDELPLLAVLGALSDGRTEVSGAEELRIKESDRISLVAENLRKMGVEIEERSDGFMIDGPQVLHGASIETHGDHRIAMAFAIASLVARGETKIIGCGCASVSYPGFFEELARLQQ